MFSSLSIKLSLSRVLSYLWTAAAAHGNGFTTLVEHFNKSERSTTTYNLCVIHVMCFKIWYRSDETMKHSPIRDDKRNICIEWKSLHKGHDYHNYTECLLQSQVQKGYMLLKSLQTFGASTQSQIRIPTGKNYWFIWILAIFKRSFDNSIGVMMTISIIGYRRKANRSSLAMPISAVVASNLFFWETKT